MTMLSEAPSETRSSGSLIAWNDQAELYGNSARIVFFHAQRPDPNKPVAERALPFMDVAGIQLLYSERDRKNFRHQRMVGQPDAVFRYKNGLIALEYKSRSKRPISRTHWREQVTVKNLLQCIIAGYLCAQVERQVTACILRYDNAALLLTPKRQLIETLLSLVSKAMDYYDESRAVSASQLASFASDRVIHQFGDVERAGAEYGKKAHDALLS